MHLIRIISLFMWVPWAYAHNKIIIQISPPRSLSTASLRMWQARGDVLVMNEPFIGVFAHRSESARQLSRGWWRDDIPVTYELVIANILKLSETSHVFIKEMSFSFLDYLNEHNELLSNPNVYFIFLLRHPHPTLCSYYKGHGKIIDQFSYLLGYQAAYEIWCKVKHAVNKPYVCRSEDVYMHPHETAQKLCDAIGLAFNEQMLHWHDLGDDFTGLKEWHELKKDPTIIYAWHEGAIRSTGFHQPTQYAVDGQGNPTFEEIDQCDRAVCHVAYDENMYYYRTFLEII